MASFVRNHGRQYVYQFWSYDECLYVGVTVNPAARFADHCLKPWFDRVTRYSVQVVHGRTRALDVEQALVSELQPTHNVRFTERGYLRGKSPAGA